MHAELQRLIPSGGLDIEDYALSEQVVPGITITEDEDDRRPLRELGIDGTWSTGLSDEEGEDDEEVAGAIGRRPENATVSSRSQETVREGCTVADLFALGFRRRVSPMNLLR